jgi:superkiller protein 3
MAEHNKSLVKSPHHLARFDPKARKELVVRGLNALSEVIDADFYFFKGEEHRVQGELKLAISYYEKALEIDPEHEDSLFWTGYCYSPEKAGEDAADDIQLDNTIRNERAGAAFQKLIAIREKKDSIGWGDYVVYYNLGNTQRSLGLYEEAIESYERAIELNPNHANSYYNLGFDQHHGSGLYEEAIESYERAIELNPNHANSYYALGRCHEKLGIYHLALENFETFVRPDVYDRPKIPECVEYARNRIEQLEELLTYSYFYNVGIDFAGKREHEAAIECYEKAIELNPDHCNSYYMLGLSQEELAVYHVALENFKTYLSLDAPEEPKTPECVEYARNRIEQLEELLTYSYFYNIGIDFAGKREHEAAIECYKKAIELNPKHANSHCNLGCVRYRIGLYEKAIDSFKHALELAPEHEASYYNIGLCQEALGNYKLAIEAYEKCLSVANHESPENQQFIGNAKRWIDELKKML